MKILIKLLFILCFVLISGAVMATTGGESKKKVEPEAETEVFQDQDAKAPHTKEDTSGGSGGEYQENEPQEVDSTNNDSVSKYNFIFYFLYKFNYDQDP